jgi:hypothetical protein
MAILKFSVRDQHVILFVVYLYKSDEIRKCTYFCLV